MVNKEIIEQAKQLMNSPSANLLKGFLGKRDLEKFFYEKCKEMGVDPDEILDAIRN